MECGDPAHAHKRQPKRYIPVGIFLKIPTGIAEENPYRDFQEFNHSIYQRDQETLALFSFWTIGAETSHMTVPAIMIHLTVPSSIMPSRYKTAGRKVRTRPARPMIFNTFCMTIKVRR